MKELAVLNVPLRELLLGYSLKRTVLVDEYVMGTVSSRSKWKAIPESPGCWKRGILVTSVMGFCNRGDQSKNVRTKWIS